MQKLVSGIHDFQKNVFSSQRDFFARLADGQSPETLFITCSDSRIDPTLITQTEPGDLFIMRNAGNLIPPYGTASSGEAATIEYAVAVLNVKDIVVCGHTRCGAMDALLHPEKTEDLDAVRAWLVHAEATKRIIRGRYKHLSGAPLLSATVQENVLTQVEHLRTHPSVALALSKGTIRLHGWVYKLETGDVFSYEPKDGQFAPIVRSSEMSGMQHRTESGSDLTTI
jgi:carbonic anhydrase